MFYFEYIYAGYRLRVVTHVYSNKDIQRHHRHRHLDV